MTPKGQRAGERGELLVLPVEAKKKADRSQPIQPPCRSFSRPSTKNANSRNELLEIVTKPPKEHSECLRLVVTTPTYLPDGVDPTV